MDKFQKSPYHVMCWICRESIFIPAGLHVSIIENGQVKHFHNEIRMRHYTEYLRTASTVQFTPLP